MAESRCLALSSTCVIEQGSQTSAFLPDDDSLQVVGSDQSLTNRDLKVLSVGIAVLDSVFVVNSYPVEEDIKELALYHRWHRGGNASNTATALAILGARTEFLGTLSSSKIASFVEDDFARRGISTEHCVMYDQLSGPLAVVLTNRQNGSRTIIHTDSDLPELSLEDFRQLDLSQYSWMHFEGRNVQTVARMIEDVDCWNDRLTTGVKPMPVRVSVELERPRAWQDEIMAVAPLADVVFVSKDFAHFMKWEGVDQTLAGVAEHTKPSATIIVTWGEEGAVARSPDGVVVKSPSFPPEEVLETLAAGDTFVGAVVYSLNGGNTLLDAITLGCQIAGAKVGMYGVDGLQEVHRKIMGK